MVPLLMSDRRMEPLQCVDVCVFGGVWVGGWGVITSMSKGGWG